MGMHMGWRESGDAHSVILTDSAILRVSQSVPIEVALGYARSFATKKLTVPFTVLSLFPPFFLLTLKTLFVQSVH